MASKKLFLTGITLLFPIVSLSSCSLWKIDHETILTDSSENSGEWLTYLNKDFGIEVQYPNKWIVETTSWKGQGKHSIGFGPEESKSGGLIWGIDIQERDARGIPSLETYIKKFESETRFPTAQEKFQFNNFNGIILKNKVIFEKEELLFESIVIETPKRLIIFSNGGSSVPGFQEFYSSFKLLTE